MKKSGTRSNGGVDQRAVKALAHPIRASVLTALNQRVASPSELAEELGEPLGNVSYHVRTLLDLGCIELVRTAPRRGAVEHYYRAVERPLFADAGWATMPKSLRRAFAGGVLADIWGDLEAAVDGDGLEQADMHLTRTPLTLDDEAWSELGAELAGLLDRAQRLQAESAKRLSRSGDGERTATLGMLLFERPAGKRSKKRSKAAGKG